MSGIVAYARDQKSDANLDLVTEWAAMRSAADQLRQWIFDNIEKDPSTNAVLLFSIDNTGQPTWLEYSTAALAQFRTHIDTFSATIS
jgi:hypothetical protein